MPLGSNTSGHLFDTTFTTNGILYSAASGVATSTASANSGVVVTSSSGVPSVDATDFKVLATGVQMKGNNTNTAPPAGFIGEQITNSATAVSLSNAIAKTITSISLTAGVWDVSGSVFFFNNGVTTVLQAGISTTNNTMPIGNAGVDFTYNTPQGGTTTGWVTTLIVPVKRILLSSTTTVYLIGSATFSTGTSATNNGMITATRVG
jgi:hypothetical protein